MAESLDANPFQIGSEQQGQECRARLSGRISIDSSPEFRRVLLGMLNAAGCRLLTLDFTDVVYIDTSGVAVLVEVLRSARQVGKTLRLRGLQGRPRYLLESTKLLRYFDEAPVAVSK